MRLLVPGQFTSLLTNEILYVSVGIWLMISKLDITLYRSRDKNYRKQYALHMVINQVSVLPYIICGIALLYSGGNGLS